MHIFFYIENKWLRNSYFKSSESYWETWSITGIAICEGIYLEKQYVALTRPFKDLIWVIIQKFVHCSGLMASALWLNCLKFFCASISFPLACLFCFVYPSFPCPISFSGISVSFNSCICLIYSIVSNYVPKNLYPFKISSEDRLGMLNEASERIMPVQALPGEAASAALVAMSTVSLSQSEWNIALKIAQFPVVMHGNLGGR